MNLNENIVMSLRFRKSKSLGKGVRLNLFKKSAGLSFGGRGACISIQKRVLHANPEIWHHLELAMPDIDSRKQWLTENGGRCGV